MDVLILLVFYRILSPFGAKAQRVAQRQEIVIGTLALLWDFLMVTVK